jgi:hypothetical protein
MKSATIKQNKINVFESDSKKRVGKNILVWNPERWKELCKSSLHFQIMSKKVRISKGKQLFYNDGGSKSARKFFDQQLKPIWEKVLWDTVMFGGRTLRCILAKNGDIAKVQFIPIDTMSILDPYHNNKKNIMEIRPEQDWYKSVMGLQIPYYESNELADKVPNDFIYYDFKYNPISKVYPVPDYFGAENSIRTDINLSIFYLKQTENGFMMSGALGVPNMTKEFESDEDAENNIKRPEYIEFMKQLQECYSGVDNAGKLFVYEIDGENKIIFDNWKGEANVDLFNNVNTSNKVNIISGHGITSPSLFGFGGAGNLNAGGNGGEIAVASEEFLNSYIIPEIQAPALDMFKSILEFNGHPTELSVLQSQPIQFVFGSDVLQKIMFVNEAREKIGVPKIEGFDDVFIDSGARTNPTTTPQL